jgi:hypothetical protein
MSEPEPELPWSVLHLQVLLVTVTRRGSDCDRQSSPSHVPSPSCSGLLVSSAGLGLTFFGAPRGSPGPQARAQSDSNIVIT